MLGTEDLAGLQEAGRASVPLRSEVTGIWQSGDMGTSCDSPRAEPGSRNQTELVVKK